MMETRAESGPYKGNIIRRAKKLYICANAAAARKGNAPNCRLTIRRDELYVEGDCDPYEAGGFGHDRICLACAGLTAALAA